MSSIRHRPMRLPPVRVLRVKNPNERPENSCMTIMSSLLACWASGGINTPGCHGIENNLRKCMDGPPDPDPPKNNINFHLSRMYKNLVTAKRRKT